MGKLCVNRWGRDLPASPTFVKSQSRDVNKHGCGVDDMTSHVKRDGERPCLRRSRSSNKDGG